LLFPITCTFGRITGGDKALESLLVDIVEIIIPVNKEEEEDEEEEEWSGSLLSTAAISLASGDAGFDKGCVS
jgi:hypothetical protein